MLLHPNLGTDQLHPPGNPGPGHTSALRQAVRAPLGVPDFQKPEKQAGELRQASALG